MIREIKFRGKRKDNGEWVYGSYHFAKGNTEISQRKYEGGYDVKSIELNCHWILEHHLPSDTGWDIMDSFLKHKVDPKSVGQFTGLLDKNGKEIFEGDLVKQVRLEIEYQTHYGDNIPNGAYTEPCGIIAKNDISLVHFYEGKFTVLDPEEDSYFNWLLFSEIKNREGINYIFFPHYDESRSQKYSDEDFIETMNDVSKTLGIAPASIEEFISLINGIEVIGNIYESTNQIK